MLIDEVAKLWTHDIFCIINGCMDGDRYDGYLERCEILGFKPLKINDALKHKFEFTRWYELLKKICQII